MPEEILMPQLGEAIPEAKIEQVLVAVGQRVREDEPLAHFSTDKVDAELPSPFAGLVSGIFVKEGDKVPIGAKLFEMQTAMDEWKATLRLRYANVRTGLLYLSKQDPDHLCRRTELGEHLRFEEFYPFVEAVVDTAQSLRNIPTERLEVETLQQLEATLWFVSGLVARLVTFKPLTLGAKVLKVHSEISAELRAYSDYALRYLDDADRRAHEHNGSLERAVLKQRADSALVFISYAREDRRAAEMVARRLRAAGIRYRLDSEFLFAGQSIHAKLHDSLRETTHALVILSPASIDSDWVSYEIGFATALDITAVPFLLHSSLKAPNSLRGSSSIKSDFELRDWIQNLRNFHRPFLHINPPFREWASGPLRERIDNAEEIWHQAVSSLSFLEDASSKLLKFVQRGGRLQCVLLDPYGQAIERAGLRTFGSDSRTSYTVEEIEKARLKLAEFSSYARRPELVSLKVIDQLPEPVMTIVDPASSRGVLFATLNGFERGLPSRPSFTLPQGDHWFEFYRASFVNLWSHSRCHEVDLSLPLKDQSWR